MKIHIYNNRKTFRAFRRNRFPTEKSIEEAPPPVPILFFAAHKGGNMTEITITSQPKILGLPSSEKEQVKRMLTMPNPVYEEKRKRGFSTREVNVVLHALLSPPHREAFAFNCPAC